MGQGKLIIFDPFRLDRTNECLWKGSRTIKLRPKAFAVLDYLLQHPGQLVSKEDLLSSVWPGTFVGDAVLKVTIREIRDSLGDDPRSPRFIETAHRRGYRFIGGTEAGGRIFPKGQSIRRGISGLGVSTVADFSSKVVGRHDELSRMHSCLDRMRAGSRQIVFVTGEAGIGKTALVDTFVRSIASEERMRIGKGQCLEQYGTGEAYLPVLEAIGRLCREQKEITETLRTHAPMWLLQMPSLLSSHDRELLSRGIVGATRERMMREMGEALEILAAHQPLVLILEDLHWSDYSTLDLISYLARQRQPAHLMVIGTYRPAEIIIRGHPLRSVKQELLVKGQCQELPLDYLSERAVGQYLSARFPSNRFPGELSALIHARTEGNPLFMVNATDYLEKEHLIAKSDEVWELTVGIRNVDLGVPDSIKQMIEKQLSHLDPVQQRTLEAASVAGAEFLTIAVAAGLDEEPATVETRCDGLARHRQFIRDYGVQVLPNGEAVNRYGFVHALYRNVLYEGVPASRRAQLHRRIGERCEVLYGVQAPDIAAELAMHYELGANPGQAMKYIQQAAENAIRRFAYQEAVVLSRRGLQLLQKLPDTPDRARQELRLHITLGVPLVATEGYAAPSVGSVYVKARELCRRLGDTAEISPVLWGLWTFRLLRGEIMTARELASEFLHLSEELSYPGLAMRGHWAMQITSMHLGEFALAMQHFEKALALYDPERHVDDAFHYAQNPGVAMRCFAAWSQWFLGRPDQALNEIQAALTLARRLSEPHGLAHALFFAATLHQFRRDAPLAKAHAEAAIALSAEHGLVLYEAMAAVILGWAMAQAGRRESAIEKMREGLALLQATGAEVLVPHFMALLAGALYDSRETEQAIQILKQARAMADRNGERYYLSEILRLEGEALLLQSQTRADSVNEATIAENCFHQAAEVAHKQQAKSLELRAAMNLVRLYQDPVKREGARGVLEGIYSGFTEALDTMDLGEARALVTKQSQHSQMPPGF